MLRDVIHERERIVILVYLVIALVHVCYVSLLCSQYIVFGEFAEACVPVGRVSVSGENVSFLVGVGVDLIGSEVVDVAFFVADSNPCSVCAECHVHERVPVVCDRVTDVGGDGSGQGLVAVFEFVLAFTVREGVFSVGESVLGLLAGSLAHVHGLFLLS